MIYVFGDPWEDRFPGDLPADAELCDVPEDIGCVVCDEQFREGDAGVMITGGVFVLDFDEDGRMHPGEQVGESRSAMHCECVMWRTMGHDLGYCQCRFPELPIRVLALSAWRSAHARWN
jgi:hypothetical protein